MHHERNDVYLNPQDAADRREAHQLSREERAEAVIELNESAQRHREHVQQEQQLSSEQLLLRKLQEEMVERQHAGHPPRGFDGVPIVGTVVAVAAGAIVVAAGRHQFVSVPHHDNEARVGSFVDVDASGRVREAERSAAERDLGRDRSR